MPSLRQISEESDRCRKVASELKQQFPDLDQSARIVPQFNYVQVFFREEWKGATLPDKIGDIPIRFFDNNGRPVDTAVTTRKPL